MAGGDGWRCRFGVGIRAHAEFDYDGCVHGGWVLNDCGRAAGVTGGGSDEEPERGGQSVEGGDCG